MSFEILEKLEAKIQTAVDTISLLQMEVDELKEEKAQLSSQANELQQSREALERTNQNMQQEHAAWQERIRGLLGKMDEVE
ncbi:septal ring assembly protein ZapB [Vibrio sp. 10N.286.49.B3]|uniref:cell division protein ZapB n=1 Tax=Vibrio sp. 10N.286.49.B3 TaxID=1880855 RepID=UPI000C862AE9|nr:cell division protein ZapB [Vibrio sp. 10N.286.49.B3]PMH46256.1 septal ring assembly protein ZapB [Vibrio sp. 10N.286.49.B3]